MKQRIYLIVFMLFLASSVAEGQVLPFTHYTPDREINALPSAEVHKVYQDRLGYIWFAIYSSGLVRYNGVEMEKYGTESGLRDVTVWDLVEDPTGRLWVSSNAGLMVSEEPLSSYEAGRRITFISGTENVSVVDVTVSHNKMAVSEDGWLWVGTESLGLIRYRFTADGTLEADTLSTTASEDRREVAVRAVVAREDGSVWVSLVNGTMAKYTPDELPLHFDIGSDAITNSLFESSGGTLWGGEQDGSIWRLEESRDGLQFHEINDRLISNISHITEDSRGNLWVSSEGSGLLKIDSDNSDRVVLYNRKNGLLSEIAFNVMEDREHNLWIAQSGGVSKLRYNYEAFTNLTATSIGGEQPVLPSPSINAVLPSRKSMDPGPCRLWAGTSEGGVACIGDTFESAFIQTDEGLTGNWVNGLSFDSEGRLWIGTSRGLNSISFGAVSSVEGMVSARSITLFSDQAVLATYDAASILAVDKLVMPGIAGDEKRTPNIWFPAYHAVYALLHNKLYTFDKSWGLPPTIYHASAFDSAGHLWVGTRDRGIYRSREPLTVQKLLNASLIEQRDRFFQPWWSTEQGAPTNQIDNLFWARNKMWVGTPSGLVALEGHSGKILHQIDKSTGLLANNATSLTLSPTTNTFWLGTNSGLAEIDPDSGTVLKTVTKADGLVDNEVWFFGSVRSDPAGNIYFGTAKGISIYRPYNDRPNTVSPIVRLTGVASEEVPGERNEFIFEYAALSFGSERQVRYQTRLLGFRDEWSSPKDEVKVNYTNLTAYFTPKTYTFEVRAVNESGIWSESPISYSFNVKPPWWISWWASLGYLLIFGLVVFVVDRIQRSRLIKREREAALLRETKLKAEAAEAQAEVLKAENELKATELEKARELEKAYHELKSTQKRLIQAEKMASLGRLSTGIAHEIKNPLNFINNFAELSKELIEELQTALKNGDKEEIENITKNLHLNNQKIEEHGKRADAIVQSMMHHSRSDKSAFELTNVNELVKTYTRLAYRGKVAENSGREVDIHTELDPHLPRIMINGQQIGQVLQNIVENAIDAVLEHKKRAGSGFKPEIRISTHNTNDKVAISVADNGPGIPEAVKEKIFEPFFTTKPTGEGTGLGLSISYDIITQIHDGSLKVNNLPEGGSQFIIGFPVSESTINGSE